MVWNDKDKYCRCFSIILVFYRDIVSRNWYKPELKNNTRINLKFIIRRYRRITKKFSTLNIYYLIFPIYRLESETGSTCTDSLFYNVSDAQTGSTCTDSWFHRWILRNISLYFLTLETNVYILNILVWTVHRFFSSNFSICASKIYWILCVYCFR